VRSSPDSSTSAASLNPHDRGDAGVASADDDDFHPSPAETVVDRPARRG
jgi:hypothetical protein